MGSRTKRKFKIQHDKSWVWHIGLFFVVSPKDICETREIYLFLCIGHHDISIGLLYCYDEDKL